ncbi:MAG: hypothetical protein CM1200mP30_21210 [Pseudomonadota bacterium]|nr:MAG: hypothetical protein CM1200mP30_21210 [Pseudomonadota bacterium]
MIGSSGSFNAQKIGNPPEHYYGRGGVYSLATRGAEDVINKSIPLVIDVLGTISITKKWENLPFLTLEQRMEGPL